MFAYFPGNYVWNLSVCIALESGAQIGEIDEMCAPLRAAAAQGDDPGTADFLQSWVAMADKLVGLADEDAAAGHGFAAADKLDRAALYYQIAERMQAHGSAERASVYGQAIDAFARSIELGGLPIERVEIPYLDGVIPGWFRRADRGDGPRPTMVYVNGLDSTKEMLVWSFLGDELARRGVNTLHIDQPGTGEALRLHGLTATPACEWATSVFDAVSERSDVDADRIGICGISLGGYYAPAHSCPSRDSHSGRCGAPTTTGEKSSADGSTTKASGRSRTTGSTSAGCGGPTTWTSSWHCARASRSTGCSTR